MCVWNQRKNGSIRSRGIIYSQAIFTKNVKDSEFREVYVNNLEQISMKEEKEVLNGKQGRSGVSKEISASLLATGEV